MAASSSSMTSDSGVPCKSLSVEELGKWFTEHLGLQEVAAILKDNKIDGEALAEFTESDLKTVFQPKLAYGDYVKLRKVVEKMKSTAISPPSLSTQSPSSTPSTHHSGHSGLRSPSISPISSFQHHSGHSGLRSPSISPISSFSSSNMPPPRNVSPERTTEPTSCIRDRSPHVTPARSLRLNVNIESESKIFGRYGNSNLTDWHHAVNKAARELVEEDIMYIHNRDKLFQDARDRARETYTYKRNGPRANETQHVTKRIRESMREKINEELKELEEESKENDLKAQKYEEAENVVGVLQTKEKERTINKKKRELNKQLNVIKKKEEKSEADKRRNSKLGKGKGRSSGACNMPGSPPKQGPMDKFVNKAAKYEKYTKAGSDDMNVDFNGYRKPGMSNAKGKSAPGAGGCNKKNPSGAVKRKEEDKGAKKVVVDSDSDDEERMSNAKGEESAPGAGRDKKNLSGAVKKADKGAEKVVAYSDSDDEESDYCEKLRQKEHYTSYRGTDGNQTDGDDSDYYPADLRDSEENGQWKRKKSTSFKEMVSSQKTVLSKEERDEIRASVSRLVPSCSDDEALPKSEEREVAPKIDEDWEILPNIDEEEIEYPIMDTTNPQAQSQDVPPSEDEGEPDSNLLSHDEIFALAKSLL